MSIVSEPVTLLLQSDSNIFINTLDTGTKQYLTFDASPSTYYMVASWSPDGSRIVYTKAQDGSAHVWIMNADGSDQEQITFGIIDGVMPTFSPDGKSILFSGGSTGNPELWTVNVDGTDPHPITHTTGTATAEGGVEIRWSQEGSYSPDGTKIAYSSTESGHAEIWVINSDGSGQQQLTFPSNSSAPDANDPNWSPDGGKIVYYGGVAAGRGYIFTMNSDGSDVQQLTYMHSDDPSWSPDGQQIYFDVLPSDGSQREAWIMNRDGSDQRLLSSTPLLPSRMPATTKIETVTVPDNLDTTQTTGSDFRDIIPPASASGLSDITAGALDDPSLTGSNGAVFMDMNRMWNENGDVGGGGDGDGSL